MAAFRRCPHCNRVFRLKDSLFAFIHPFMEGKIKWKRRLEGGWQLGEIFFGALEDWLFQKIDDAPVSPHSVWFTQVLIPWENRSQAVLYSWQVKATMQRYCNLLKLGFIFLYNKGNSANLLEFPKEGKIEKKTTLGKRIFVVAIYVGCCRNLTFPLVHWSKTAFPIKQWYYVQSIVLWSLVS